jgi:hypothetical protein
VVKNANEKDVRKARKAELQRDEAIGYAYSFPNSIVTTNKMFLPLFLSIIQTLSSYYMIFDLAQAGTPNRSCGGNCSTCGIILLPQ